MPKSDERLLVLAGCSAVGSQVLGLKQTSITSPKLVSHRVRKHLIIFKRE